MKVSARIPVMLPSGTSKPFLFGVDAIVDIAEHDDATAPVACRLSQIDRNMYKLMEPRTTTDYRWTSGKFIKERDVDEDIVGDPSSVVSAYLMSDLCKFLPSGANGKHGVSPRSSQKVLSDLGHPLVNMKAAYAAKSLPSLSAFRQSGGDDNLVEVSIARSLAHLSHLSILDGVWHEDCPEPTIANMYEVVGVRRTYRESFSTVQLAKAMPNWNWSMFPIDQHDLAIEESNRFLGDVDDKFVSVEIDPPEILMSGVYGDQFVERELARLVVGLSVRSAALLTQRGDLRAWVPEALATTRDSLLSVHETVNLQEGAGHDDVELLRTYLLLFHQHALARLSSLPRFEKLAMEVAGLGLDRWDDRNISFSDISSSQGFGR